MCRVYAYLIKQRFIDRDVIAHFAKAKMLYESCERSADNTKEYHNAVFVGYDENGVPRHAHKRGLYIMGGSYRGNVEGSDPAYSFHHIGVNDTLYVFEAPIDLLSHITIYRYIISVFKLIQDLLAPSGVKGKNQFQLLIEKLPPEHKARWFAGAAVNSTEQAMQSVLSTALSRFALGRQKTYRRAKGAVCPFGEPWHGPR